MWEEVARYLLSDQRVTNEPTCFHVLLWQLRHRPTFPSFSLPFSRSPRWLLKTLTNTFFFFVFFFTRYSQQEVEIMKASFPLSWHFWQELQKSKVIANYWWRGDFYPCTFFQEHVMHFKHFHGMTDMAKSCLSSSETNIVKSFICCTTGGLVCVLWHKVAVTTRWNTKMKTKTDKNCKSIRDKQV